MADVKWIKIVTDIFDNRKIRQIESLPDGDSIIVVWIKLLCLAGNTNDSGLVYFTREIPYTDQMLATTFNRPLTTVQMALRIFEQFEMIEVIDDFLHISNWEKYQNVEGMDKIREQNRLRKQRQRERQRQLPVSDASRDKSRDITQQSKKEDIDKDKDKDKDRLGKDSKSKLFYPPSVKDVAEYCASRDNNVDAESFVDFYESKGWMVGRSKMKDWKAAVRTWEKRERNKYSNKHVNTGVPAGDAQDDLDDLF